MYSLAYVREWIEEKPLSAMDLMYNEIIRLILALVMGLIVMYELPPNKGAVILIPVQNKDTYDNKDIYLYVYTYFLHVLFQLILEDTGKCNCILKSSRYHQTCKCLEHVGKFKLHGSVQQSLQYTDNCRRTLLHQHTFLH